MGWVSSFQGFCQINFAPRLFPHSGILKIRKLRSGQVRPNHLCLAHSTDDPPPVPMALRQVSCNGGYSENHPVDTRLGEGLNMHGLSPMSQLSTKLDEEPNEEITHNENSAITTRRMKQLSAGRRRRFIGPNTHQTPLK